MTSSTLSKGVLGALGTSGTVAAPGVSYGLYRNNLRYQEYSKIRDKGLQFFDITKDRKVGVNNPNYVDFFPSVCLLDSTKNILKHENFRKIYSKPEIKLGDSDFLSDVENTKSGCFNIQTKEENGSIIGFMELIAETDSFLMVLQSDFNLAKDSPSFSHYFISRMSFLKKEDSSWKLDKAFAWKEKIKKANEIFSFSIDQDQIASAKWKKDIKGKSSEIVFQNVKFWDAKPNPSFSDSEIMFWYKGESWYKKYAGLDVKFSDSKELKIPNENWIFDNELKNS